ncbi:MAG: hypothetical protein H0X33_13505 [Taibaiella sp.]|nr:hypothetical protein [Taibaiella sp.]
METNKKNEVIENETMTLVLEEFNQELKSANQVNSDLVREVNTLNSKVDAIKSALDTQKPITVSTDVTPIENTLQEKFAEILAKIPQVIPVQHHHHFDKKDSKKFIIGGIILLLVIAISSGLSLSLWSENSLLHENALKFRMIRVVRPANAHWADSVYFKDPEAAEQITRKKEADRQTLEQAETNARQVQLDAERAKVRVEKLRKR